MHRKSLAQLDSNRASKPNQYHPYKIPAAGRPSLLPPGFASGIPSLAANPSSNLLADIPQTTGRPSYNPLLRAQAPPVNALPSYAFEQQLPSTSTLGLGRPSLAARASIAPPRQSMAPRQSMLPQKPTHTRRSSIGRANHNTHNGKDPRLSDKRNNIANVQRFLKQKNCPYASGDKQLTNPTQKEFVDIATFICTKLDKSFSIKKRFEEDILAFLKAVEYPFVDNITKSALSAPGKQSWPGLLAMLAWMVEVVTVSEDAMSKTSLWSNQPLDNMSNEDFENRVYFEFASNAYLDFMCFEGQKVDEYAERMHRRFDYRYQNVKQTIDAMRQDEAMKKDTLKKMTSTESPMSVEERENTTLKNDRFQFKGFVKKMLEKKERLLEQRSAAESERELKLNALKEMQARREVLVREVEAQPYTPEDVEKLDSEYRLALDQYEQIAKEVKVIVDQCNEKEIEAERERETVDGLGRAHNKTVGSLSSTLQLIDMNAPVLLVDIKTGGDTQNAIIKTVQREDYTVIKPRINEFFASLCSRMHDEKRKFAHLKETHEHLTEALAEYDFNKQKMAQHYEQLKFSFHQERQEHKAQIDETAEDLKEAQDDLERYHMDNITREKLQQRLNHTLLDLEKEWHAHLQLVEKCIHTCIKVCETGTDTRVVVDQELAVYRQRIDQEAEVLRSKGMN